MTYQQTLKTWEAAREQAEESRLNFLAAKNFGRSEVMFTAAVIYAEAANLAEECRQAYEDVVLDELHRDINDQAAARLETA